MGKHPTITAESISGSLKAIFLRHLSSIFAYRVLYKGVLDKERHSRFFFNRYKGKSNVIQTQYGIDTSTCIS
ncbi:MAG: hypothetical protein IKZ88_03035 [Neisseriaceae bacterium]|nr:hypothetical protein [Neisseriaceae bacterium]